MALIPDFTWDVDRTVKTTGGVPVVEHVADFVMFQRAEEKHYPNGRVQYINPQRYFVQRGYIYDAQGRHIPVDQAPEWVLEEYRRTDPRTRRIVGLMLPEDREQEAAEQLQKLTADFSKLSPELQDQLRALLGSQAPRMPEKAPKISNEASDTSDLLDGLKIDSEAPRPTYWTCPDCGTDVEPKKKGVHIARLKRTGKCS